MVYMLCIILYLIALLFVAFHQAKKVKTQEDFSVAGRSLSPWILVMTMLATWVGTGSILGNAGHAYSEGLSAMILPLGGVLGMILLTFIAPKVRDFEKFSVPEIIESRYGTTARILVLLSLVTAYLVIVSYQFNAGGGVLQYVLGKKAPVNLTINNEFTPYQIQKGYICYNAPEDFLGDIDLKFDAKVKNKWTPWAAGYTVKVVESQNVKDTNIQLNQSGQTDTSAVAVGSRLKIKFDIPKGSTSFKLTESPSTGNIQLQEYKLSSRQATLIAAVFIIAFTMIAGLVSVAYIDIGNGILIIGSLLITFPYLWIKAGGWDAMTISLTAMGRPDNMNFMKGLTVFRVINLTLPTFLLILGDANLYQRFFASKSAKGAKQATIVLIFVALIIEILIIGSGWIASSLISDAEEGKYVLIVTALQWMPMWLGCIFITCIVAIIMSTADSFLLVPSTSLIRDIYMAYINPKATEKHIVFLSRLFVLCLGIIAFMISMTFDRVPGFLSRAFYAYTIYGTSVTPALVAALFWKGATKYGAVASIIGGMLTTLLWKKMTFMSNLIGSDIYTQIDEVLPAILISVIALVSVSLLTQKKCQPA